MAPVVLRGVITKNQMTCFINMLEWYKFAARRKEHTDKSLRKMVEAGKRYIFKTCILVHGGYLNFFIAD